MITKYTEKYEITYHENRADIRLTAGYLYENEYERADHVVAMKKAGFLESTQRELNVGSIHDPDYRLFSEYTRSTSRDFEQPVINNALDPTGGMLYEL